MTSNSGIELDLVGMEQQEDLVVSGELGLGNALIIIPSDVETSGQVFLVSSTLALSVLEPHLVTVEVPTTTEADTYGENHDETELESTNFGFENAFHPVCGITDAPFDFQNEGRGGKEINDLESSINTQTAGSSKGKGSIASQTTHASKVGVKDLQTKSRDEIGVNLLMRPTSPLRTDVAKDLQVKKNTAKARRINAEAARKYRANKRLLDGKRVDLIKTQELRIKELESQVQKMTHDLQVYRNKNSEEGKNA